MWEKLAERTVEVILSNQIGYERVAMACSASFAKMYGCPPERIEDLKTVVAEAALNAMQHGNQGRADAKVKVSLQCKNNALVVRVMDEGIGIDTVPPVPVIDEIIEQEKLIVIAGPFPFQFIKIKGNPGRQQGAQGSGADNDYSHKLTGYLTSASSTITS